MYLIWRNSFSVIKMCIEIIKVFTNDIKNKKNIFVQILILMHQNIYKNCLLNNSDIECTHCSRIEGF